MLIAGGLVVTFFVGFAAGEGNSSAPKATLNATNTPPSASASSVTTTTTTATQTVVHVHVHTRLVTRTVTRTVTLPGSEAAESEGGEAAEEEDGVGSDSHAGDAQFCSEHECIGDFEGEDGYVVECADGTFSHAGGISGACSDHGGEA